ncbi:hypothetical protein [Bdellovibrio bacteriovorus]|uniref:FCP1 homology domain-containing protein n=1 Tax=Bdellovibrio bacteriovorus TaxID=959 RepID=A0A1Z3N5J3_BDEBC|nr:hypothetical protein [Bdellovibrio bacteriovorus]ASD62734.1 hypothetical protein B9G79_03710 [Bdellovibrio bacteriovorus]
MKLWLAILILILSFQPQARAQSPSPGFDIVFDIDWTTFYSIKNPDDHKGDRQIRVVEDKAYRHTDFLPEMIEALMQRHPDARISFFSGGTKSRNETLLSQVHLSDGRSLLQIAHRVFSKDHLQVVSQDETLSFPSRFKKNLSLVMPEAVPARTILIDDQTDFAVKPHKAVGSLGIFDYFKNYDSSMAGKPYAPASFEAWSMERNKALLWLAMLDTALENARVHGDLATEAEIQWNKHPQNRFTLEKGRTLIARPKAPACGRVF